MLSDYAPYIITGLVAGTLYGLAATGLVLTYKTSGVLNFSHGAIGAGAAYVFYDLKDAQGMPTPLVAVIVIGIIAPAFGLLLSLLAARLVEVSTAKRAVATVGVLLVIQGLIQVRYGATPRQVEPVLPDSTVEFLGLFIGYDQMITTALAVVLVLLLEGLFRRTKLGLQMRAVVDNSELIDLARQSPFAIRAKAWIVGTMFAAISGILLAPAIGLDSITLTFVVVQAFGAAAVGRFSSTGVTFVAAIGIGVVQNVMTAPKVTEALPFLNSLPGLNSSLPFIVLFGVLVFTRRAVREQPVKRALRPTSRLPSSVRYAGIGATLLVAILAPLLSSAKTPVFTIGAVFVTIYASLFLLVEVSNQVSLCQVTFVAIGGTTFAHLTYDQHWPWLLGVIAAAMVALPVGALLSLPAIRLSGTFLALATLGFGVLVEKLFYGQGFMFGSGTVMGRRPGVLGLDSDTGYYYLCLAVAIGAIGLVLTLQRSRLGRLLSGLADSPIALSTQGSSINITRVMVFGISASMAAVAGALDVGVVGQLNSIGGSTQALASFNSLIWLAVLAFVGRSTIASPIAAAIFLVVLPAYSSGGSSDYLTPVFGMVAVLVTTFGDSASRWFATQAEIGRLRGAKTPIRHRTREAQSVSHA